MDGYNIGDLVRIRTDLRPYQVYGGVLVNKYMADRYGGETATITGKEEAAIYRCYRIDLDGGMWLWSEKMFDESYVAGEDIDFSGSDMPIEMLLSG